LSGHDQWIGYNHPGGIGRWPLPSVDAVAETPEAKDESSKVEFEMTTITSSSQISGALTRLVLISAEI
jgi:hypothetical protein